MRDQIYRIGVKVTSIQMEFDELVELLASITDHDDHYQLLDAIKTTTPRLEEIRKLIGEFINVRLVDMKASAKKSQAADWTQIESLETIGQYLQVTNKGADVTFKNQMGEYKNLSKAVRNLVSGEKGEE